VLHRLLPTDGSVVMFMVVRRPDGGPTGFPMTGLLADGALRITTYRKAAKARYLLADDRVCCILPDPERPARGVAVYGRARPVDESSFEVGSANAPAAIEVPAEVSETVRDRLASQQRMVFEIDVVRVEEVGVLDAAP
jgi:hypothetical protein